MWTDKQIRDIIDQDTEKLQQNTFFDQLILLLKSDDLSRPEVLQEVVQLVPSGWRLPADVEARLIVGQEQYQSKHFRPSDIIRYHEFRTRNNETGMLEIHHQRDFREIYKGDYRKEESRLMQRVAQLVGYFLNHLSVQHQSPGDTLDRLFHSDKHNLKSLSIINQVVLVLKESESLKSAFYQIAFILPHATRYSSFCAARLKFNKENYESHLFRQTPWSIHAQTQTKQHEPLTIELFYLRDFPTAEHGPFTEEEYKLLNNVTRVIKNYLDTAEGQRVLYANTPDTGQKGHDNANKIEGRNLFQNFLNRSNRDRDIYHDLMPFKVKEILIVANLYDAYSIEKEGRFSEYILGEYHQLNLTSLPRITGATNYEEAHSLMHIHHFDLIIVMVGANKQRPLVISRKLKEEFPYTNIFLLLNNNVDAERFKGNARLPDYIDHIFAWNGDSRIFFAMVKLLEDQVNADNDTRLDMCRVILLVEDSVSYYSRYLPLLFSAVMEQTKRIIDDISDDELYKVLRLRARPKVLLAKDYEEAMAIYKQYKNYLLCLISDVKFERNGQQDSEAGFRLVDYVKSQQSDLPVAMQSSRQENEARAKTYNAIFINKNSQSLQHDIQHYISFNLGFGSFHFHNSKGEHIATASNLMELESRIKEIPEDSILHHARKNHFSLWLMARGETEVAQLIAPYTINDFKSAEDLRQTLLSLLKQHRREKLKGRIVDFSIHGIKDDTTIVKLAPGALGGKGRGVAFVNTLLHFFDFSEYIQQVQLKIPRTAIIGTDEYIQFLDNNHLHDIYRNADYETTKRKFLEASLSHELVRKLRIYLQYTSKPLAVRSSGLFEDTLTQPFAGIFATYLIPNNHESINHRLADLTNAIKMVYASVFAKGTIAYLQATNYKVDDERMAIVIQEVVGSTHENCYYPHISGVAQSYNYYPFGHIQPEDGFALMAVGLGKYVADGHNAFRFSPKHPNAMNYSTKELIKNSQTRFIAVDLTKQDLNFLEDEEDAGLVSMGVHKAEKHGTLKHLASVYDANDDMIRDGLDYPGQRIVNFSNILKHNYIPLAQTLNDLLAIVKQAVGSAVEMEFAVDLNKDHTGKAAFYLLQIKPMGGTEKFRTIKITPEKIDKGLLYSENSMGNGRISKIRDVIYIHPERFDKMRTQDMVQEIEQLNDTMQKENRQYLLIGPGRWGSSDRFLGVPVIWPQISQARVIVEVGWDKYLLDASLGSHFFHNVTTMNVGYLSVHEHSKNEFIRWNQLKEQPCIAETRYFRHIRFPEPLDILLDGRKQKALISYK